MPTLIPPRIVLGCLCALALANAAYAQAAAEYAVKSSTGALSGSGSSIHLGACPVDTSLISCVSHYYPVSIQIAILALCVFVGTLMFRRGRRV
jgi:hypothetical protein